MTKREIAEQIATAMFKVDTHPKIIDLEIETMVNNETKLELEARLWLANKVHERRAKDELYTL